MRIGIATIFDNENYGNRLQDYALQIKLSNYAEYVISLKNKPKFQKKIKNIMRKSPLSELVWVNHIVGKRKKAMFLEFNNRFLRYTKYCYWMNIDIVRLLQKDCCDMYCVGSDQVWNPHSGYGKPFHYLAFSDYDRTFSYAASFGIEEIPEQYQEDVRKGLNHIKFISVREDAGKRIVEELTGQTDVQVLVDPTMLLTPEQWDAVAEKPRKKLPEQYLLTYFLGTVSGERRQAVEQKAAELGCETIWLMDKDSPFYAIGPGHFVYLIKHARMVCTDSFHGSVFSFLYGKSLAIFDREGGKENMSSRIRTLADKFSLENCLVKGNHIPDGDVADYTAGYAALEEERKKSKAFLDMVFQEAERAGLCK